jgi:phage tail tape-measure protein
MLQRQLKKSAVLLFIILSTLIISCGSSKNDMADFERDKQEMRAEIQNAIAQIDRTLDTAQVKIDTLGNEASRTYDSTIQELKEDKGNLQQRLSELDKTAHDQWQKFKSDATTDINKAYNKIRDLDSNQSKQSE